MITVGKLRLCLAPLGVGAFFVVGKSTPGRLRPIWHGGVLSEHCRRPPASRRLGNPASFIELMIREGEALYTSKRDAASFFDVLQAPSEAHMWFCCPPLRAGELARAMGITAREFGRYLLDQDETSLTASQRDLADGVLLVIGTSVCRAP